MKKAAVGLALVLACTAPLACGGSSGADGADSPAQETRAIPTSEVFVSAHWTKTFTYVSDKATTEAGSVLIGFTNPQKLEHDVAIEDSKGEVLGQIEPVSEGSDSMVIDLKPGTYAFFCTFPGHREKGMEGTLIVK